MSVFAVGVLCEVDSGFCEKMLAKQSCDRFLGDSQLQLIVFFRHVLAYVQDKFYFENYPITDLLKGSMSLNGLHNEFDIVLVKNFEPQKHLESNC